MESLILADVEYVAAKALHGGLNWPASTARKPNREGPRRLDSIPDGRLWLRECSERRAVVRCGACPDLFYRREI
jgi:hypothetical protein